MSKHVAVAVIGAGMAGRAHAFGYRNVSMHPALAGVDVELSTIVDVSPELATSLAGRYGFAKATGDLDVVLADGSIDAVSVALPNFEYAKVIPQLLSAGKHVFAEKPLGRSAAEAYQLAAAADSAQRVHSVGFSWRRLGAVEAIAQLVKSGAVGTVWHGSAWYLTDYAATEATPLSWRYDRERAGGGAIVDLGAHVISVLEHIVGPIQRVLAAEARTVIRERPIPSGTVVGHGPVELSGEIGQVTTDDVSMMIVEHNGGGIAQINVSRIATGVPNSIGLQIVGSEGAAAFDSVHPDEFQLFQTSVAAPEANGVRTVTVGPEQPSFAYTTPMPARGVGLGYGAAFIAEAQEFVGAIVNGTPVANDFWTGYRTMLVCDAAQRAAADCGPIEIGDLDRLHRGTTPPSTLDAEV